jgi:hypothetical protein
LNFRDHVDDFIYTGQDFGFACFRGSDGGFVKTLLGVFQQYVYYTVVYVTTTMPVTLQNSYNLINIRHNITSFLLDLLILREFFLVGRGPKPPSLKSCLLPVLAASAHVIGTIGIAHIVAVFAQVPGSSPPSLRIDLEGCFLTGFAQRLGAEKGNIPALNTVCNHIAHNNTSF